MSVSLQPSSALGFPRPLTQQRTRSLAVTNHNNAPVAFKVKTTAPKLYCVRPNSGRVEPGETVEVAVMLQALKDEPPLNAKCKDKFLIQSTIITPEKETLPLQEIWNTDGDETRVHQQKLRVTYLPPEGQTVPEEDESVANMSSMIGEQRYDTVRQQPNGVPEAIPEFNEPPHEEQPRAPTPTQYTAAHEEQHEEYSHPPEPAAPVTVNVHPPPPTPPVAQHQFPAEPSAPAPQVVATAAAPAPKDEPSKETLEYAAKYQEALREIERLRALLASAPKAPESAPPTEVRRRTRKLSEDESSIADSDVRSVRTGVSSRSYDDRDLQQDGVPLQVVVVIALTVFTMTYLFF
ncbi:PapD-like protein [Schizophyllum commune]